MTTKITIDPALVEEIYKSQFANVYEGYTLGFSEINVVIDFNTSADAERFSLLENGVGLIVHDRIVLIDIHRFKDLTIEWCAKQGWMIERRWNGFMGRGGMLEILVSKRNFASYNSCDDCKDFDYDRDISISEAELAAINFCWEQIHKEGKDD